MHSEELNDRAKALLKLIIEQHISHGQPVASKSLVGNGNVALSSATIRSVMAELEDSGYLSSPHTSSGRIPTALGYRFFVNRCLSMQPLDKALVDKVKCEMRSDCEVNRLLKTTSTLLARMTQLVAVASLPKIKHLLLRHVEFLPLSKQRVLVILVINQQQVQNRVIQLQEDIAANELVKFGNYLNEKFAGMELSEVRGELINALQQDKVDIDIQMSSILNCAKQAFTLSEDEELLLEGQSHLFDYADVEGVSKLKSMFQAFAKKRQILSLLDKCLVADGVQIFIGDEVGFEGFEQCSMVSAPYSTEGKRVGVVGVIGPSRMPYQDVIPIVDISAKLLSGALN